MNCNDNVRHINHKRKFTKQETKLGRDIVARKRLVKREATLTVMILKDLNFHFLLKVLTLGCGKRVLIGYNILEPIRFMRMSNTPTG